MDKYAGKIQVAARVSDALAAAIEKEGELHGHSFRAETIRSLLMKGLRSNDLRNRFAMMARALKDRDGQIADLEKQLKIAQTQRDIQKERAEKLVREKDALTRNLVALRQEVDSIKDGLETRTREVRITPESHPVGRVASPIPEPRFTPPAMKPIGDTDVAQWNGPPPIPPRPPGIPKPDPKLEGDGAIGYDPSAARDSFMVLSGIILILLGAGVAFLAYIS